MAEKRSKAVDALLSMLLQEEMVEVRKGERQLYIGIPKEISFQENRIPLIPESVALLVNRGHEIIIETGAGKASNIEDSDFSEAGAKIVFTPDEVYKADLILKVAPPSIEEIELIKPNQHLISILQLGIQKDEYVRKLAGKKITAIGYEYLRDEDGLFPIIQAMSEIVGSTSILIADNFTHSLDDWKQSVFITQVFITDSSN